MSTSRPVSRVSRGNCFQRLKQSNNWGLKYRRGLWVYQHWTFPPLLSRFQVRLSTERPYRLCDDAIERILAAGRHRDASTDATLASGPTPQVHPDLQAPPEILRGRSQSPPAHRALGVTVPETTYSLRVWREFGPYPHPPSSAVQPLFREAPVGRGGDARAAPSAGSTSLLPGLPGPA